MREPDRHAYVLPQLSPIHVGAPGVNIGLEVGQKYVNYLEIKGLKEVLLNIFIN